MENNQEIVIQNEADLISAIVATIFTPKEMGDDTIVYDKETILNLARLLDNVCQQWYNVNLESADLDIKLKGIE